MRKRIVIVALVAIALEFLPLAATAAQSWDIKVWEGAVETPGVSDVNFAVNDKGIMELLWDNGEHEFKNLEPQNVTRATKKLTFRLELNPYSIYECTLTRESSIEKFQGACITTGASFKLSMSPKNQ